MHLSNATCIEFKEYILLFHALSGNQTYELVFASAMSYSFTCRNTVYIYIYILTVQYIYIPNVMTKNCRL